MYITNIELVFIIFKNENSERIKGEREEEKKEGSRKEESGHANLIGKYRNYETIYLKLETS